MMGHTKRDWVKFSPIEATLDGQKRNFISVAGVGGRVNVALIPTHYDNAEANAHLIAAAPDMFGALVIALSFVGNDEVRGIVREALTKAKGLTTR